jgi:kinesin family member C1
MKTQLESKNASLITDLDTTRQRLLTTTASLDNERRTLDDERRAHRIALDDQSRELRHEIDHVRRELTEERQHEVDRIRRELTEEVERLIRVHREELRELEKRSNLDLEDERRRRLQEVEDIKAQLVVEQQNLGMEMGSKDRAIQNMRGELEDVKSELDREQTLKSNLQKTLAESSSKIVSLEGSVRSLQKHVDFLESGSKAQSDSFVSLERQLQEALQSARESKEKLIKEETLRRILFNQVQELKGNIRVMCRVRPTTEAEENEAAKIAFPDVEKESRELEIQGPEEKSSLGNVTRKTSAFSFDRVFGPSSQNEEVFGEISQLVQSALDGYNVCIFCYGQTGSGKTYTMSSEDGMIPRATHMIYEKATSLQEKGWTYSMEGSFVEVYNEEIHDLLGNPKEFDKKKHEIRHDEQKKQTTITGLKTVPLDSPNTVESILRQAATNRSVAATKSNERSSRSHSIFILKLLGKNSTTNEISEGTLNLVDLAGSERLKQSGAEGDRMKETQNINKSLSCLGDVIGALGQSKEGAHIPYRNSKVIWQLIRRNFANTIKLTYLLQYSLGGNSKTLMFVMVSPLEAHLRETLTSLKFATKVCLTSTFCSGWHELIDLQVHNTHIGTAKKSTKIS